jgi:NADH dehydrogenase
MARSRPGLAAVSAAAHQIPAGPSSAISRKASIRLIEAGLASGRTYELGGPEIMSLREIFEFTLRRSVRKRLLVPVPWQGARVQGMVLGLLPSRSSPATRSNC